MTNVHILPIEKVIESIKSIENVETDYALAKILEVDPGNISKWRKRGTIPYPELLEYCENRGIILNSILTGEGKIYKERIDFTNEIVKKIMVKESFTDIEQVAEILNTTQYQLGLWKKSRQIPMQIIENYCETKLVNINWLLESPEYTELVEVRNDLMTAEEEVKYKKSQLADVTKELDDLKASLKKIINK